MKSVPRGTCLSTFSFPDRLGNVRDLTDNFTGLVVSHTAFDAWGNITAHTGLDERYGFTSREFDVDIGLQYNRARWYDPTTGRWIMQDPMGLDAGDTNLYRYVHNRPTYATDPSGKYFLAVGRRAEQEWSGWLSRQGIEVKSLELGGGLLSRNRFYLDMTDDGLSKLKDRVANGEEPESWRTRVWNTASNIGSYHLEVGTGYEAEWTTLPYDWNADILKFRDENRGRQTFVGQKSSGFVSEVFNNVVVDISREASEKFNGLVKEYGGPISELWNKVDELKNTFGADIKEVIDAIVSNPSGVKDNFFGGLSLGFSQFFNPDGLMTRIKDSVSDWLFGDLKQSMANLTLPQQYTPETIARLGMDVVLEVTHAKDINTEYFRQALEDETGIDSAYLASKFETVNRIVNSKPEEFTNTVVQNLDALRNGLSDELQSSATSWLTKTVVSAGVKKIGELLVPGVGVLKSIYSGAQFAVDNASRIGGIAQNVFKNFKTMVTGPEEKSAQFVSGLLKDSVPVMLSLVASQAGLGNVPKAIQDLVGKLDVRYWFQQGVSKLKDTFKNLTGAKGRALTKEFQVRSAPKDLQGFQKGNDGEVIYNGKSLREQLKDWKGRQHHGEVEQAFRLTHTALREEIDAIEQQTKAEKNKDTLTIRTRHAAKTRRDTATNRANELMADLKQALELMEKMSRDDGHFVFHVGLLPPPNPNALKSVKVSGKPSNDVGVYLKKHDDRIKVGSTGNTKTFRTRYTLSNPEGKYNIWYEIKQTRFAAPHGVDDSVYSWSDDRQRRFDEEYVDRLVPPNEIYRSPKGDKPVSEDKWRKFRHIFGYGNVPENFGR